MKDTVQIYIEARTSFVVSANAAIVASNNTVDGYKPSNSIVAYMTICTIAFKQKLSNLEPSRDSCLRSFVIADGRGIIYNHFMPNEAEFSRKSRNWPSKFGLQNNWCTICVT